MMFCLHDPDVLGVDFEQVIISVILFTVLLSNQIIICTTSAAHMPLLLSCLLNPSPLATDFEQVTVSVICFLILICFMSAAYVSPVLSPLYLRCIG